MAKLDSLTKGGVQIAPPRPWGVRHLQAALLALCCFVAYALRANLSVAVVAMVAAPRANGSTAAATVLLRDDVLVGAGGARVFEWDEPVRGALLSAFFWGYMPSQVPGGILAQRVGGSRILAASMMATSAATIALPLCAQLGDWRAVFANRVLQGLTQAPVFPSIYTLLGVWVPPQERATITTCILSAQLLGPMFGSPLCGLMAGRWGWPSIFYAFGALGLATGALLWLLGADRPSQHKRISAEEVAFIAACVSAREGDTPERSPPTPWRSVCSSVPVWMAWITLSSQDMAYFTFITTTPTYFNGALHFDIEENGLLSSLPYLTGFVFCYFFSAAFNFVLDRNLMSLTNSRKFFNAVASVSISACVVLTGYVSSKAASVALICLSMGFTGGTFVAVQPNFLDLAPLFAGPIYSVGNMMAAVLGVVGPQVVGLVVTDTTNATQWKTVFWGVACILMTTCVFYTWFASAELQPWNDPRFRPSRKNPTIRDSSDHERLDSAKPLSDP